MFIKPSSFTCCYNVDVFLVAFDPKTDFTITPWLEGKVAKPLGLNEAIVGDALPIMTGSLIPFYGTAFNVVGTMEPTGMKFFDQSLFMTMESAYQMAENSQKRALVPLKLDRSKVSAILVQADENISPDRLAIRISYAIPGVKAIASDEVVNTVRRQLSGLMHGILVICSILWVLALVMIGFAFYMIVNERQREFGLLRGMGAKRRQVMQLVLQEAFFISLAGGIIGLAIGSALLIGFQEVMVNSLKLPYLLPAPSVLYQLVGGALVFSVLTGLISALIPAVIASRLDPYEAIRQGE